MATGQFAQMDTQAWWLWRLRELKERAIAIRQNGWRRSPPDDVQ